ncbi:Transthyretin-like family protein [Caenorhabditis elegans]|uniref:Transthyretin-like family protein n=1 Tax=Caenorhabditis elegans TaxID=6239 RepID=Q9XWL1_CAEEL|nr:Transthyretin-like family protein [Caenorhabditis elegans]CAA21646.1 Transthyretin-like family protein [Caenorhabditis elegans]|eukprot:NP_502061.1 TransThyretin-Related family domain [Caenorhabditis elegans]
MSRLAILVLLSLAVFEVSAKLQNVTVKGIAVCNKRRMANSHVILIDKDTLDPNDELAQIHTNKEGEFELFGEEDEIGKIEPYIRIHHSCNTKPGCERVSEYQIPQEKIGEVYDMTYVTLDIIVHGEKTICN